MAEPDAGAELEERLGYRFRNPALLLQALTHKSFICAGPSAPAEGGEGFGGRGGARVPLTATKEAPDRGGPGPASAQDAGPGGARGGEESPGRAIHNERLELLGDAVLGLRACERLLERFPEANEGEISRLRSWLVSARQLTTVARQLDLGTYLRLSRAEHSIGGRQKPRLLANAVEAVIAAVYLDGGYAAAAELIDRHVLNTALAGVAPGQMHEFAYKSALQEWAHAAGRGAPTYRVIAEAGPAHKKQFTVEVSLEGDLRRTATGSSKKDAEQRAAAAALAMLGKMAGPE